MTVRYEGRVQGVGFRATVEDLSRKWDVVGYVRNRSDGSVELLAEGVEAELSEFHQSILKHMSRYVVSHDIRWSEIEESSFQAFEVAPTA